MMINIMLTVEDAVEWSLMVGMCVLCAYVEKFPLNTWVMLLVATTYIIASVELHWYHVTWVFAAFVSLLAARKFENVVGYSDKKYTTIF